MFVAELDRPWMDTPFLLQGFILEDAQQVAQMQQHCQWVMIDPLRSTGPDFEQRPKKKEPPPKRELGTEPQVVINRSAAPRPKTIAELRAERSSVPAHASHPSPPGKSAGSPEAQGKRPTEFAHPISQHTVEAGGAGYKTAANPAAGLTPSREALRNQSGANASGGFRGMFGQLKRDMKNLFSSSATDDLDIDQYKADGTKAATPRPSFLPETVQLTIYEDSQPVESEIESATEAFAHTQTLLKSVVDDIRSGSTLQVEVVEQAIEDMVDSMVRNPDAMMWVARMREQNASSYDHGLRVAISLIAFGRHLGYPKDQLAQLGVVGLLLDIGKIRIAHELLDKNARLTTEEFAEIKRHVNHSVDILNKTANVDADVLDAVAQHHERIDGSGYPFGLKDISIGIFGKMAAIADTYSAVTTKRAYAEATSPHEALQMLSNWSGSQFQTEMVEQFIQSIGVFPVGSLIELSTGEVAVVVTHNKQKRLRPKVLVVTEMDKKPRKHPSVKDLIYDVSDNPVYIRRGLPSNAYGIDTSEYYLN